MILVCYMTNIVKLLDEHTTTPYLFNIVNNHMPVLHSPFIVKVKYLSIIYSSHSSMGLYGRAFRADSGNGLRTNPVPSTIAAGFS